MGVLACALLSTTPQLRQRRPRVAVVRQQKGDKFHFTTVVQIQQGGRGRKGGIKGQIQRGYVHTQHRRRFKYCTGQSPPVGGLRFLHVGSHENINSDVLSLHCSCSCAYRRIRKTKAMSAPLQGSPFCQFWTIPLSVFLRTMYINWGHLLR